MAGEGWWQGRAENFLKNAGPSLYSLVELLNEVPKTFPPLCSTKTPDMAFGTNFTLQGNLCKKLYNNKKSKLWSFSVNRKYIDVMWS